MSAASGTGWCKLCFLSCESSNSVANHASKLERRYLQVANVVYASGSWFGGGSCVGWMVLVVVVVCLV